jgi:adenylate cyclase
MIDPGYSSALAYLADCIGRQIVMGRLPYREGILEAAKISERAIEADPEDAAALAVGAWVFSVFAGKHDLARQYAERALQLQPNSNFVCTNAGYALIYAGEFSLGRNVLENAFRISPLDPRSWFNYLGRGLASFFERKFEEALILLTRSTELSPLSIIAWRFKAATLVHLGRIQEAQDAVKVSHSLTAVPPFAEIVERTKLPHEWMRQLYLNALQTAGYQ